MNQPERPPRQWTAEQLAYIAIVVERLRTAGPLSGYQLAVLRKWWNGGFAEHSVDEIASSTYDSALGADSSTGGSRDDGEPAMPPAAESRSSQRPPRRRTPPVGPPGES